ncbi:universal stress protein [Empedobacter brevis]|uniref:Universal stress protein n=2 Tax=Empedobacter brevis TaxID=247 RepID=A0A511NBQ5_9FLAO|nr:universal stress protein [Empedobacter brevis]GEM50250.1 universal stress protein [Empedobacter brevis NBRC 14943 = ATCC 43319]
MNGFIFKKIEFNKKKLQMKKALITLDLRKNSDKLVQAAIEWARAFDAHIILLHVELVDSDNKSLDTYSHEDKEKVIMRDENMKKILEMEQRLTEQEISFARIIRFGNPQDVILDVAKYEDVDLIFIGLNKHSAAYKFLIGSVADLVVKKTEIPVLLIPND